LKKLTHYYSKWILISTLVGVSCGIASAIFLASLDWVTTTRQNHTWLVYCLPIGGLLIGWLYQKDGRNSDRGNNLLIDEFHDPKEVVPLVMAPLVYFGTLATHLFGGSAGREGTAVQMGGSIADQIGRWFKIDRDERRTLLMAGMSGGFASVFGVPFAGTIFGIEVLFIGRLHLWALIECAISAFIGHFVTLKLGIHHTEYFHPPILTMSWPRLVNALVAGVIFGLAARAFSGLSHLINRISKLQLPNLPIRAAVGGALLSLVYFLKPVMIRYAGLGVPIIVQSIKSPIPSSDWYMKLLFTAFTLGVGFKGGEVTPLLFIGGALGNALGSFSFLQPMLPLPNLAAMGLVAVFAGAANTPIACTLMAAELFGPDITLFAAIACFASYAVSGRSGIYQSQPISHFSMPKRFLDFFRFLFRKPPLK